MKVVAQFLAGQLMSPPTACVYNDGLTRDLVRRVGEILNVYNMLPHGAHVGVAVSGGADSVVLLHILHALLQGTDKQLTVLHVNHGLRGAESEADENFVVNLAGSLSLPVLRISAPIARGNLEQEARRGRQKFFLICRQKHGIDRIALGHTRSDQAETVLFRLLRGSGLAGLAGMAPVTRSGLIRPLLFTPREEIREFAEAANLRWREDGSNGDLRFRRNRLRLITLPQLGQDYNPKLEEVLARSAQIAQAEENYWSGQITRLARRLITPVSVGLTIPVAKLQQLHCAQQRRLLRKAVLLLRKSLRSIDLSHIDGILRICESEHGHDRVMIPGVDAIRSFETLLLTGPETMKQARGYELPVLLPAAVELPFQAGRLAIRAVNTREPNCVTVEDTAGFAAEKVHRGRNAVRMLRPGEELAIRNWEPGDTLQPVGASRPDKIKTLFQENRIVLWERRHWPVLVVDGEIAWVRQFGTDARFCPPLDCPSFLQISFEPASRLRSYGK